MRYGGAPTLIAQSRHSSPAFTANDPNLLRSKLPGKASTSSRVQQRLAGGSGDRAQTNRGWPRRRWHSASWRVVR